MVRRLRHLPPPSENTLLVKDDTQEGGLGWKNVGNVIKDAKTAGQVINANNADRILRNVPANISSELIKVTSDTAKFCGLVIGSRDSGASISVETRPDVSGAEVEIRQKGVSTLMSINGVCNINGTAKYARYASSDTSKGTIEERLTNLGFNRVPLEIINLPYTGTLTSSSLELLKEGNFLKLNLSFEISGSASETNCIGNIVSHSSDISYNQEYTKPDFIPSGKTISFLGTMSGIEDVAVALGQSVKSPFTINTYFTLITSDTTMTLKFDYQEYVGTKNSWVSSISCDDIQTFSPNIQ